MDLLTIFFLIIFGFVFTFFLPGFVLVETYFSRLAAIYKIPLYLIISVLVSSWLVYLVSLLVGFSRVSIIIASFPFIVWLYFMVHRNKKIKLVLPKKHAMGLAFSVIVFLVFAVSLYPGIFTKEGNYFVMSGPNWQDTAMHLGIIESISQGNFPPQAPYYSGTPLTYYYFSDYHTAIITTLKGSFFPRVLVYDNSLFAAVFFLSLYALSYYITRNKTSAVFVGLLGTFFSGLLFINFFRDILNLFPSVNILDQIKGLLVGGYSMEPEGFFQMSSMSDYFLQNRPMMVGLPSVVMVSYLLISAYRRMNIRKILLAGAIVGLVVKFQMFAFVVAWVVFALSALIFIKRGAIRKWILMGLAFIVSTLIFSLPTLLTSVNNNSLLEIVRLNFLFESWDASKSWLWHLRFTLLNFGLPFMITLFYPVYMLVAKKDINRTHIVLYLWLLIMVAVPYLFKFTIYFGDMFKFFYFMVIPVSLLMGSIMARFKRRKYLTTILIIIVLFVSTFTSFLTLAWSATNKNSGYSEQDYEVGIWIRENTPKRSVFISAPTVHTPITQIGGRLRVLSYINWPHSHGYNNGEDNVFVRLGDINNLFENPNDHRLLSRVMNKYKVDYLYFGVEEQNKYPLAGNVFDEISVLRKVYNSEQVSIYQYSGI